MNVILCAKFYAMAGRGSDSASRKKKKAKVANRAYQVRFR